jgi:hypothetical protein
MGAWWRSISGGTSPNIIGQNLERADGVKVAACLYQQAPKDGRVSGALQPGYSARSQTSRTLGIMRLQTLKKVATQRTGETLIQEGHCHG